MYSLRKCRGESGMEISPKDKNSEKSVITGLDKIKKIEENSKVDIKGLDMIQPIDDEDDIREDVTEEEEIKRAEKMQLPFENINISGKPVEITGLDRIKQLSEPDLPKLSSFSLQLIGLVNKAKEYDKNFNEYGADKHKYKFFSTAPVSMVKKFEEKHKIKLPVGYVNFLTQVGNGGAGPEGGLYSLDEVEFNNYLCHSPSKCSYAMIRARQDYHDIPYTIENKKPVVDLAEDEEKWFEWYENLGQAYANGGNYGRISTELYNGLIEICSSEDGRNLIYLVCTGKYNGQVAAFTFSLDDRIHIYNMTFENWMLNYFKSIIEKY